MGNFHLLSPVTGSEVNDSRPVVSGAFCFERPLGLCPGFRLEDPTYSVPMFILFFLFFFFHLGLEGNLLLFRVSHLFGV